MARNNKSKPSILVDCANCGKQTRKYVSQIHGKTFYCSLDCYHDAKGNGMSLPDQRGENNPFWKGGRSRVEFKCEHCGKLCYDWADSGRRFCGKKCEADFPRSYEFRLKMRGVTAKEKNGNWKGGVTEPNRAIRNLMEYKAWRKSILKVDNYTCVRCGNKLDLHAHHIDSFANHPGFRFDPDNGVTLCEDCHFLIHGKDFRADVQSYATSCVIRGEHACVL